MTPENAKKETVRHETQKAGVFKNSMSGYVREKGGKGSEEDRKACTQGGRDGGTRERESRQAGVQAGKEGVGGAGGKKGRRKGGMGGGSEGGRRGRT